MKGLKKMKSQEFNSIKSHVQISIPPEESISAPIESFLSSYIDVYPIKNKSQFLFAAKAILHVINESHSGYLQKSSVHFKIKKAEDQLILEIHNKGCPVFFEKITDWENIKTNVEDIYYENLGREGQVVSIVSRLMSQTTKCNLSKINFSFPNYKINEIAIRPLKVGEGNRLTQLFYDVYQYNYINEFVYFPEKIDQMILNENLLSIVGVLPDGKIAGNVSLLKVNESPPIWEAALGLVNPQIKSSGLFSNIFDQIMKITKQVSMDYCIFDFVTNHDYSQKMIEKYNYCKMSIHIGSQISQTQAQLKSLGIGEDPQNVDRYSMLLAIIPFTEHPFGAETALPIKLGEMLEFLLEPLGIHWIPSPRFFPLNKTGHFKTELQSVQKSVIYKLIDPGVQALENIVKDWRYLIKSGYHYAAVEMPLNCPGVGQAYDYLSRHGFFISGFVPFQNSNVLGFRLQSIGPAKIDFDQIVLSSPTSKKLLNIIREDYERSIV